MAALLGIASSLVIARAGPLTPLGRRAPSVLTRPGVLGVAFVLGLRGTGGIVASVLGIPRTTASFRVLNLVIYSPLCLGLVAAIVRMEERAAPV